MKKQFTKLHKLTVQLTDIVTSNKINDLSEDDLDILAESIDTLNNIYEKLYDEVFVVVD